MLAWSAVTSATVFAEEDPRLVAEIASALRTYEQSIHSLHATYSLRLLPGGFNGEKEYPPQHWTWAQHGTRQLVTLELWDAPGEAGFPTRKWASFDGNEGYELFFHLSDVSIPNTAHVGPQPSDLVRNAHFPLHLGWRLLFIDENLVSLLEQGGPKPISRDELHGVPCVFCEVGTFRIGEGPEHIVLGWFDQAVGWLPRRITICPLDGYRNPQPRGTPGQPGSLVEVVEIAEFRDVEDQLLGGTRKVPWRMLRNDIAPYEIEVESIALNTTLPEAMFRPQLPVGTEVKEGFRTSRQKSTFVGGAAGQALKAERTAADLALIAAAKPAVQPPMAAGRPVDARPGAGRFSISALVFAASVIVLILAVVARRRGW
jgi:hypothetical protein